MEVICRDGNVEQAMRVLKKKLQREGFFREIKERRFYIPPSEKRQIELKEKKRRAAKNLRKRMERDGF